MKLYHYTTGHKLASIQRDNKIRPSRDGILWLSSNPVYELSALKPVNGVLSFLLLLEVAGIYRFHVTETAQPWYKVCHSGKTGLNEAGKRMGASPDDWYLLFHGVTPGRLEYFDSFWKPIGMPEAVKKFEALGNNIKSEYVK